MFYILFGSISRFAVTFQLVRIVESSFARFKWISASPKEEAEDRPSVASQLAGATP